MFPSPHLDNHYFEPFIINNSKPLITTSLGNNQISLLWMAVRVSLEFLKKIKHLEVYSLTCIYNTAHEDTAGRPKFCLSTEGLLASILNNNCFRNPVARTLPR